MEYDELAAIKFIRNRLSAESNANYDDDEILNVIDIMWDYYEDNGFMNIDLDEDGPDELDVEDLMKYVKKMIAKDKNSPLTIADAEKIVEAELDYEDSIQA